MKRLGILGLLIATPLFADGLPTPGHCSGNRPANILRANGGHCGGTRPSTLLRKNTDGGHCGGSRGATLLRQNS